MLFCDPSKVPVVMISKVTVNIKVVGVMLNEQDILSLYFFPRCLRVNMEVHVGVLGNIMKL